MDGYTGISRSLPWALLLALCLSALGGCSGVEGFKQTLRSVSNTLVIVTDLTMYFEESPTAGHLEDVEEKILYACQSLLDSADYRFQGENIPFDTQINVVLTADQCQRVVDETRPELEELHNRISEFPTAEHSPR